MIGFVCYLFFGGILQFICFHYATVHCGSDQPAKDYGFSGGGHGIYGGPSVQLVPRHSIVVERDPMWYGMAFDVYNATEFSTINGAPVGTWFRTWGPFFSTYTYQDVQNSQPTVYMRASIESMIFQYNDDYAMRCDGNGSPLRLSEGQHWFVNRIRNFFGSNQGFTLKVWRNGILQGFAEETFHGAKSITFKNATLAKGVDPEFASAVMLPQKFEQDDKKYTQWLVNSHVDSSIPFYETNGMGVLYAFRIYNIQQESKRIQEAQKKKEEQRREQQQRRPYTLAEVSENTESVEEISTNMESLADDELHE
jgi:hypothetical protein